MNVRGARKEQRRPAAAFAGIDPPISSTNFYIDSDESGDDDDRPLEYGSALPLIPLTSEGAFRHAICVANQSEYSAYKEAMSGNAAVPASEEPEFYIPSCIKRHANCKMCGRGHSYLLEEHRHTLRVHLNVLGVCRQLYEEANHLLWATNTFSFDDPTTCQKFLVSLNAAQKHNLTSIHINAKMGTHGSNYHNGTIQRARWDGEYWGKALKVDMLNMLRGVRSLHLCIDQGFECVARGFANSFSTAAALAMIEKAQESDMEPILRLRTLSLQDVTVIVSDDGENLEERHCSTHRWTASKKNEYAKSIRGQLLDPRGAQLVKTETEIANLARKKEIRDNAASRIEGYKSILSDKRDRAIGDAKWARRAEAEAELAAQKAKQVPKKKSKKAAKLRDTAERLKYRAVEARAAADASKAKEVHWREQVANARERYKRALASLGVTPQELEDTDELEQIMDAVSGFDMDVGEDEVAQTAASVQSGEDESRLNHIQGELLVEDEDF